MLSAVENFGPLVGPAVALSHHHHQHPHAATHHHHHHHHNLQASQHHQHTAAERGGYALDIDATVRVSAALSPLAVAAAATDTSAAGANYTTSQAPLAHAQLQQLNALQALKLQQQFQQQYEQHLSNLLNATAQSSTIGVVLPPPSPSAHRPQPQVASSTPLSDAGVALAHKQQQQQHQQQQHHFHLQQQQQHSVSVSLTRTTNAPKYMSSPRATSSSASMMPLTELTAPPKPLKPHEQQPHITAHENGQNGPINLVTNTSSAYASSCSNSASIDNSRPSSSSSSVDVENDESMSPPVNDGGGGGGGVRGGRKLLDSAALLAKHTPISYSDASASSAAAAAVVAAAAYQYNYTQLYGSGVRPTAAGLYNAPVIFATHDPHAAHVVQHPNAVHGGAHAPTATYHLGALAAHSPTISPGTSGAYSAEYLKALQNAVFQTSPPLTTPVFQTSPLGSSNGGAGPSISKSSLRNPATQAPVTKTPPPSNRTEHHRSMGITMPTTTTTTKLSTGTFLYEKPKRSPTDTPTDSDNFFKIPSGKEGSLKHRILARPANSDKLSTAAAAAGIEVGKVPVMRAHNSTSSFKKGSYIELSNGSLRRVEDMRTEDFIQCAERSPEHQLIESTVVKINQNPPSNTVTIAFSYDRNQSKVDMEVSTDHPFFVYGQGWASCNPELSFKAFGLRCQRLQVGDICISLTKREPPNIHINNINNNNITNNNNSNNNNNNNVNNKNSNSKHPYLHAATTTTTIHNDTQCLERDLQPPPQFILSDSVYAAHLNKNTTSVCLPTAQYPILRSPHGTMHFVPAHLSASVATAAVAAASGAHPSAYAAPSDSYARFAFPTPQIPQQTPTPPHQLHITRAPPHAHADRTTNSEKSPPHDSALAALGERADREQQQRQQQQQIQTVSMSQQESARKRRWSAPESFSNSEDDDDEAHTNEYQPPVRQKSAPNAAMCTNYKPYLPGNTSCAATTNATFSTTTPTAASATLARTAVELNCDFLTTNYK